MMERGTEKRTAGRLITIGVGLLMIVGLVLMARVFMRGFVAGAAFALVAALGRRVIYYRCGLCDG
jgi:hypothetical protein